jgi:uncharacterized tellurite resistance protein B-like protein
MQSAMALCYALLLDEDADRRAKQLEAVEIPVSIREEMQRFFQKRSQIEGAGRIALIDLAIPTLRSLSEEQYADFRSNVKRLMESDTQIDLFEFVLQKILIRHLDLYFSKATGPSIKFRSLIPVLPDVGTILTALTIVGSEDPENRQRAFQAGVRELLFKPSTHQLELGETTDLASIDAALDRLAQATPEVKRTVLKACAQAVAEDGEIAMHEYEVLRTVADCLDCPMPPLPKPAEAQAA